MKYDIEINLTRHQIKQLSHSMSIYLYGEIGTKIKNNTEKALSIIFNDRLNKLEERIKSIEMREK